MSCFEIILMLCLVVACCLPLPAESYRLPPDEIVRLIDSAPTPIVRLSPDNEWMLFLDHDAMPSIEDISRRMLRLAGLRMDPLANSQFRSSYWTGLSLRRRTGGESISIPIAADARISQVRWAHDSQSLAFAVAGKVGTELWVVELASPTEPKRLSERLSTVLEGFHWMPAARSLVCVLVPSDRGAEPEPPRAPTGPNVQESAGNTSPTRTYQDLLASPHDEALFEHYGTGQICILGIDGNEHPVGTPGIFYGVEPSPDGQYLLVTRIGKPYSYLQTVRSFPQHIEVWNLSGELVHLVADVPLAKDIPVEGVRTGPRQVTWQTGHDASLIWVEALDGGDPNVEADHRDQWLRLAAPFTAAPEPLVKVEHRAFGVSFVEDEDALVTVEYDRDRRWVRTLLHQLSKASPPAPKILTDRSVRDLYGDPGRMVMVQDEAGHQVALQHGPWIYRTGNGATPEGFLPFLDRQNLETLTTERMWQCQPGCYEVPVAVISQASTDDGEPSGHVWLVTQKQTPIQPPNYFLRNTADDLSIPMTDFADPTPEIRGISQQLITYEREDGVPLTATLYLPANYQAGQRLPLLVWAYPLEFNDADTAGQVGTSPWLFTRIRGSSHLALLTQGYAIMDGATIPIIGDPETMNDTFVEQLVASAKAAIDKAVELGVADPHRVAVGGHSYGAFMTACLLAHSDLFQAGLARSGAYNRTLTPFGFQSERRPLWEAKDVYFHISPFMHADKIKTPLLLVHGEEDNNSGTFPMQSRRMYQAIKGNGGTVRLVMLPKESHGYRARESVLHVHAETVEWLDKYVKHAISRDDSLPSEMTPNDATGPAGQ